MRSRQSHSSAVPAVAVVLLLLVAALDVSSSPATAVTDDATPTNLTVNYATAPLGIESNPRFGWDSRTRRQTAYQIQTATSEQALEAGSPTWDTGRVGSADDIGIEYTGPALQSRTAYVWRVRVWDEQDQVSAWSSVASWETGLLDPADWGGAQWIGGRQPQDHDWADMTMTATFRVTDASSGISFMFHARPVGLTWGEGYVWRLRTEAGTVRLVQTSRRYRGAPYNPQSETNPKPAGTTDVAIGTVIGLPVDGAPRLCVVPTVCLSSLGGITPQNLTTTDHRIRIEVAGDTITTWLNDQLVDTKTVTEPGQIQPNGSIGFAAGSAGIIRDVTVESPDRPTFSTDFADYTNPFESGIPTASDGLRVISAGTGPANNTMLPIANPAPLVRTDFEAADSLVERARLYAAAGGWPSVSLNGEAVTDGTLIPDHTSHDKTVLYNTFDVTDLVRHGEVNTLGAELGRGWYGVTTPNAWYWHMVNFHGAPRLLAQLEIIYEDGSSQVVVTDPATWRTADGPTTFDSVYTSEKYDARLNPTGWDLPGFDDGGWQAARAMNPPGSCPQGACSGFLPDTGPLPDGFVPAELRAQENEPVQIVDTFEPIAITEPTEGVYVFDYGQIMTGHARLHLTGTSPDQAGMTIILRTDERLDSSGNLFEDRRFRDGRAQTDSYTLAGTGTEIWEPKFRNGGFRYAEVRGLEEVLGRAPTLDDAGLVTARNARTAYPRAGQFSTDNALLNRIQSNVEWASWNNTIHKITDTPAREKNGWTGDAVAAGETMLLNNQMVLFVEKWAQDMRDSMISTGEVPEIVPGPKGGFAYEGTPGWSAVEGPTPPWDAAYFVLPWELYEYTANIRLLDEMWPTQKRFMEYYATWYNADNDYTKSGGGSLGEYASTGGSGKVVIDHQWNYYMADYMATVGELLGYHDEAAGYRALADHMLEVFIDKYWDSGTRSYQTSLGNLETMNLMAIEFDMVPGSDVDPTDPRHRPGETVAANKVSVAAVVADSIVANGYHLSAGIFGIRYLFTILDDYGYTDLAYQVASQTDEPSWGYKIGQGATSLWEFWDGTGTASHNHPYFNSIGTWFHQGLAGITPAEPGYRRVTIKPFIPAVEGTSSVPPFTPANPQVSSSLDEVSGSIETVRGLVASSWSRNDDGRITLTVTVPSNTPAEVWVPTMGMSVAAPEAATFLRTESTGGKPYAVYDVPPGTHIFN